MENIYVGPFARFCQTRVNLVVWLCWLNHKIIVAIVVKNMHLVIYSTDKSFLMNSPHTHTDTVYRVTAPKF